MKVALELNLDGSLEEQAQEHAKAVQVLEALKGVTGEIISGAPAVAAAPKKRQTAAEKKAAEEAAKVSDDLDLDLGDTDLSLGEDDDLNLEIGTAVELPPAPVAPVKKPGTYTAEEVRTAVVTASRKSPETKEKIKQMLVKVGASGVDKIKPEHFKAVMDYVSKL